MDNLRKELQSWLKQGKFIGQESSTFYEQIICYENQCSPYLKPQVLLVEEKPEQFLAAFLAILLNQGSVFLGNPHWQQQEWQQVSTLIHPDLIWGQVPQVFSELTKSHSSPWSNSYIFIPTGGTSGQIKFVAHNWRTLTASVQGFQQYFDVKKINSFCVLPLYHVSGLMQFLRSFMTQGNFHFYSYAQLKLTPPSEDYRDFFLSLVPTQLQFLLDHFPQWLTPFKTIFLGGAPAWPTLLEQARQANINLAPTYGMSETAAQIATLKAIDFKQGCSGVGQILPHVKVSIMDEQGLVLDCHQVGKINIQSSSLFLGYYPELHCPPSFSSGDLGYVNEEGYLWIMGRQNQRIITGGEKVFPAEVEAAILASKQVKDVVVLGLPDRYWGEIVVAVYVPHLPEFSLSSLETILKTKLSPYKCPKAWFTTLEIPRSPSGKVNYAQLQKQLEQDRKESQGDRCQ